MTFKTTLTTKKANTKFDYLRDYNICHEAIDIHDPVHNKNVSGFYLKKDRLDGFMKSGFVDSFVILTVIQYSWWSYRAGARGNNKDGVLITI
jgi:exodeoxyribonuclease-3